ncbi:hypothetical protein [Otariodibacter sp.]|uniref:DUF6985 domain-containing protein n=1 Tax=Otariodibacter sp. TaxID=3030919 RepID=UPI002637F805|nr:hypothetical protein [Otariodibacter sp.]
MNTSDLIFDYGWRKNSTINFQQVTKPIQLVFSAKKGQGISDEQTKAFEYFSSQTKVFEDKIVKLLDDYIQKYQISEKNATPRTLLFNRDGSFGLLCDCDWDIENGIAIVLSPTEYITIQDDFL